MYLSKKREEFHALKEEYREMFRNRGPLRVKASREREANAELVKVQNGASGIQVSGARGVRVTNKSRNIRIKCGLEYLEVTNESQDVVVSGDVETLYVINGADVVINGNVSDLVVTNGSSVRVEGDVGWVENSRGSLTVNGDIQERT